MRATSAVSSATSLPAAPMTMPRSADASAGASLMPSPTIATDPKRRRRSSQRGHLVFGHQLGAHVVDPELGGNRPCRRLAVAGEHDDRLHALLVQQIDRVSRRRADPIGDDDDADGRAAAGHEDGRAAARADRIEPLVHGLGAQLALLEQPVIAENHLHVADRSFGAATGQRRHADGRRHANAACGGMLQNRLGNGMLGPLLDRGRERNHFGRRDIPRADDLDDLRRAARQRAGLVERDAPHLARALEVRAALDEHALARRAGERRNDRDRCRDDQRTRARNHQQHERPVEPRLPAAADDEGPATATSAARTMTAGV